MDIQASRLMTIHCAEVIDSGADARTEISAIKIFVPNALHRVVYGAIQIHGAMGVSGDTPVLRKYSHELPSLSFDHVHILVLLDYYSHTVNQLRPNPKITSKLPVPTLLIP